LLGLGDDCLVGQPAAGEELSLQLMQDEPDLQIELAVRVVRGLKSQGMAEMCLEDYSAEQVVYEHFGKHSELEKKTGKDQEDSVRR
jgi:hypothetical protein